MLWEVDISPRQGLPDRGAEALKADAADLHLPSDFKVNTSRGYLLQSPNLSRDQVDQLARDLLVDTVVEQSHVVKVGETAPQPPAGMTSLLYVLPKPGVMDPVAQSAKRAIEELGHAVDEVRTFRKYWFADASEQQLRTLAERVLSNDAIEEVHFGPLPFDRLQLGEPYEFKLVKVTLDRLDDAGLMQLSREGQLYLQLDEMQTIQAHYRELRRVPTDVELETLAQTWSEHCCHKTLTGRIEYRDENGERRFDNLLKETIFAATQTIRRKLGDDDWCVSVFEDNAGIVRFDEDYNVVLKVETHNHPSAIEPYGGANTGIGGVIRDSLGTGLGAKPVCNTDVFCFAPPDIAPESIPPGVLHPRRVIKGVVSGVRDYGNRMGIPTVNGAVYFDERYLGNPLVYCGNAGIIPRDKSHKQPQPGDYIVAIGGRTGRDGIHGATFSSTELTSQSESLSGGAVQLGNAITEKMVVDVVLEARDRGLYTAITDCGAGGFSSAVGEMGEKIGAEVWLDRAPLKYEGLSYTEIWISEAQERMVLSVPEGSWQQLEQLCAAEGLEATILGRFEPTGELVLKYHDTEVGRLSMDFLHNGRPKNVRQATYAPAPASALAVPSGDNYSETLEQILASPNVCSKHWIIRQYDHEVQGGSTVKPLVGRAEDGPSDAAVVRPRLDSDRGMVISCGMNPHYGDLDTYHMAASAIDEAIRNAVAVGADPERIAILDNFCWGDCAKPETLGSLARAAIACQDLAVAFGTPFISGKDSLNNEFSYTDSASGERQTIAIPPTLLISAMGQIDDVSRCVTMDFKSPGSRLYLVGQTRDELGGSHFCLVNDLAGGRVPKVGAALAKQTYAAVHSAITAGLIRACHDLSEGGLAAAVAEMAIAGRLGANVDLSPIIANLQSADVAPQNPAVVALFSESNSRLLCEVSPKDSAEFERAMSGVPCFEIGEVAGDDQFGMHAGDLARPLIDARVEALTAAWQRTLDW